MNGLCCLAREYVWYVYGYWTQRTHHRPISQTIHGSIKIMLGFVEHKCKKQNTKHIYYQHQTGTRWCRLTFLKISSNSLPTEYSKHQMGLVVSWMELLVRARIQHSKAQMKRIILTLLMQAIWFPLNFISNDYNTVIRKSTWKWLQFYCCIPHKQ